jgi:hypothetical protein
MAKLSTRDDCIGYYNKPADTKISTETELQEKRPALTKSQTLSCPETRGTSRVRAQRGLDLGLQRTQQIVPLLRVGRRFFMRTGGILILLRY